MADTKRSQDLGYRFHKIFIIDAQKEIFRPCRVSEGPQNIEHSPEAQLPPDGTHILHCQMVFLGKHEAEADFIQKLSAHVGILLNIDSQGFETICCSAL